MKKIACVIVVVLSFLLSVNLIRLNAATNVYEDTYYYSTSTGILWWKKTYTWKADSYRVNDAYITIATMKYMGGSFYWDGGINYQTATISMQVGSSVAETNSWTFSASLGMQIPTNAGLVVPQMGGAYSNSVTVTTSTSSLYSVVLTTSSPQGYYTFEARMNMIDHKIMTYETTSGSAVYTHTGYVFTYLAQNPYFYCAYTTFQVN